MPFVCNTPFVAMPKSTLCSIWQIYGINYSDHFRIGIACN